MAVAIVVAAAVAVAAAVNAAMHQQCGCSHDGGGRWATEPPGRTASQKNSTFWTVRPLSDLLEQFVSFFWMFGKFLDVF